ncbi:Protein crossbronx [Vanrija pseudolonga]|uniref:Protein crossbronx n=1 Tax=Vanrija pseudolonga TaxID=143232 RepID=A0AAF1BLB1_9TREE|nr:Protein crossbronx [Vanrija pseudolonga]
MFSRVSAAVAPDSPSSSHASSAHHAQQQQQQQEVGPLLAAELAIEYQSLRAPGNCPTGMYLFPSPDTLLKWVGVFFVHRGPYAGAILRFTLAFQTSFPRTRPSVFFDSDVFHPLVEPKTREWTPRGRLAQWQPRVDHVAHLLRALKESFRMSALDAVTEHEASNRQVWSMYHHSRQTFLSLTAQRARQSATRQVLFGEPDAPSRPMSLPASPSLGGGSSSSTWNSHDDHHMIRFTELDDGAVSRLWGDMRRSLGER